jgi:hypothetical protein
MCIHIYVYAVMLWGLRCLANISIIIGVQRHGVGNWIKIKMDPEFVDVVRLYIYMYMSYRFLNFNCRLNFTPSFSTSARQ